MQNVSVEELQSFKSSDEQINLLVATYAKLLQAKLDFNKITGEQIEKAEFLNAVQAVANANQIVYADNLEFQFLKIKDQHDKFIAMKLDEAAVTEWAEQAKTDAVIKHLEETSASYNAFFAGYDTFINNLIDKDIHGKKKRELIWASMQDAFIKFTGEIIKQWLIQQVAQKTVETTSQAASIASAAITGQAIAAAYAVPASLASTASFGGAAVAGQTALTASILATKALTQFEQGGLIGGRRHSQGGTIIEAEKGEFIMSRKAVQSIGLENLNAMNQGNTTNNTPINISINGGMVDQSFVENELADAIKTAIRRGSDFGVA